MEDLRLAREDLRERRLGDAGDALERVAHLRLLLLELRLVCEILEAAAAAGREMRARRIDALRPGAEDLGRERFRMAALHLRHARAHAIAGKTTADEDDVAVQPCNAVAAVRERLDVELELFVSRHRRGHSGHPSRAPTEHDPGPGPRAKPSRTRHSARIHAPDPVSFS